MSYREHADILAGLVAEISAALSAPKRSYAERWKEKADKAIAALRNQEMSDRQVDIFSRARDARPHSVGLVELLISTNSIHVDPEAIRRELDAWNLHDMRPEQEQFAVKIRALIEGALEDLDPVTETCQPDT